MRERPARDGTPRPAAVVPNLAGGAAGGAPRGWRRWWRAGGGDSLRRTVQRDPIASEPLSRRARREWAWLGGVVLLLAALLVGGLADDRRRLLDDARQRLADQARAVDLNLTRQIEGAHAALGLLREDLAAGVLVPGQPPLQRWRR